MAELRTVALKAGFAAVQTYVASGNVVLESELGGEAVEAAFEEAIALAFGFHVDVVVRSDRQWVAYSNHNPFSPQSETHPERVMICLGKQTATDAEVAELAKRASQKEHVEQAGDAIWLYFGDTAARSKLNTGKNAAKFTTRNWTTVKRLREMLLA